MTGLRLSSPVDPEAHLKELRRGGPITGAKETGKREPVSVWSTRNA